MDKKLSFKHCPDCGQTDLIIQLTNRQLECPKCLATWRMT